MYKISKTPTINVCLWFCAVMFALCAYPLRAQTAQATATVIGTPAKVDFTDLYNLSEMMASKFSSEAQSSHDTNYYNIILQMKPAWRARKDGYWFYVEQAVSTRPEKPYRQRVYHIFLNNELSIGLDIFELPNSEKYVGSANLENPLSNLSPDSLIARKGCGLILVKQNAEVFSGGTTGKGCKSSLQGADYVTSEVTITSGLLLSWDRGWNKDGKLVWGPEKGGYEFDKLEEY